MKAAVIQEPGGPDRLGVEQVPEPEFTGDEVVLKVYSAGLNHLDTWVRKDGGGLKLPKPRIPGSDAAGVVIAAGPNVTGVAVGDEVFLDPGVSCGSCKYCNRGEQNECVSFEIVGLTRQGTFAEEVAVPARNVLPKPSYMSFAEAGAFALEWRMLMARAQFKPGQVVLIHGIGDEIALGALQLAKLAGAEVIVTSSSGEKLDRAGQIGADHTINYEAVDDVGQCVRDVTSGAGVDIVIDTLGAATWPIDLSAVHPGGKVVRCGAKPGAEAGVNPRMLYWNQLTIMGAKMGSDEDCHRMMEAVTTAEVRPVIDSVMPLENVRDAMDKMEAGEQFGKIVLEVFK